MKNFIKKAGSCSMLPYVLLLMAAALFLHSRVPFLYTVNDDLFMKNIVSGAYLGEPDVHTVYMEYPICLVLTLLYRLAAGIPWYGIVFFLLHMTAWGAIFFRCLIVYTTDCRRTAYSVGQDKKGRQTGWLVAAILLLLVFVSVGFYHVASMQFTVTAAILGAAALVWFVTADPAQPVRCYWKDQLVTALFVFASFNIRRNVLLMLVPMAGMLWLACWLQEEKRLTGQTLQKYVGMAAMCVALVAVCYGSYAVAYRSPGWKNYKTFNDHATVLYDYYGWPEYEQNKALYEELDISYEGWYGAKNAYFLSVDSGINTNAMVQLARRSEQLHQEHMPVWQRLKTALVSCAGRMVSDTDRPLNLIVLSLYLLVLAGLLLGKHSRGLQRLAMFFTGRMFSWLYVTWEGRYPTRITQSLLLAECAVLLAMLLQDAAEGYHKLWLGAGRQAAAAERAGMRLLLQKVRRPVLLAGAVAYLLVLGAFGLIRVRHVYRENTARLEQSADLQDVKDYCALHQDNFYFVDSRSISNDTEAIFDGAQSAYENYIVFGGWLSESPVYLQKLADRKAADVEAALLDSGSAYVIAEANGQYPIDYISAYFGAKYEAFQMEEIERFGKNGQQFCVYRLRAGNRGD